VFTIRDQPPSLSGQPRLARLAACAGVGTIPSDVAPSYFAVRWHHDSPDEPVLLFEELNEQRLETRKVEEFADGRRIRSDRIAPELSTSLSWELVPSEAEIDSQSEFTVQQLSADEFEAVWNGACDSQ
jgi:hypothetical protein